MLRALALLLLTGCSAGFLAGSAVADLTPDHPVPLGGYSARRGRPMTGVHDRVLAKALWLESGDRRICLVTTDLIGSSDEFRGEILRRLPPEAKCDLILAASHTHSGPGALSRNPLLQIAIGKFDPALYERYLGIVSDLVVRAAAARRPGRAGVARTEAPELQHNRRAERYAGTPPTDPEVLVLRVGRAVVVNYAAHGTVLGSDNFLVSGDWPGAFQRILERKCGATVLYTNGAEGDLAPAPPEGGDDFVRCEKIGEALAVKVEGVLAGLSEERVRRLLYIEESVSLPKPTVPFAPTRSVLGILVLNDAAFLCVPGEMSAELGLDLKRRFRTKGFRTVAIVGLANDHLGYFLTEEQYRKGGYEREVSLYGPKMGEFLIAEFERMATRIR